MGTVNVEDVMTVAFIVLVCVIVLFSVAFAYTRGFEAGKLGNVGNTDAQDAFRSGYNLGYMQGIEAERKL